MKTISNLRNEIFSKDIYELLNEFVNTEDDSVWQDKYFGEVIDNNDPSKKGRIKVRVYGLFPDSIPKTDIPWAIPDFSYVGSVKGSFIIPPLKTKVRVYFDHGDIYCPVYEAKGYSENDLPDTINNDYPDTMILYSTDKGEYFSINRVKLETKLKFKGKLAIGTETTELLDVVSQLMQLLITSVTPTGIGPQQLSNVTNGQITLLKTKLDAIKGTI